MASRNIFRTTLAAFAALAAMFASAQTALTPIPVGPSAQAIAINPITNKIYVANEGGDNVTVIDGESRTSSVIGVGDRPYWLAVNPETNRIYVSNFGDSNVTVLNGATGAPVGAPLATGGVGWTAINPVTNRAYMIRYGGGDEFNVILGDLYQLTSATFSYQPVSVAVNPVTNTIYLAHAATGDVVAQDISADVPYPPQLCPNGSGGFRPQPDPETGAGVPCINVPDVPVAVAVNPVTDFIYAVSSTPTNQISVIRGRSLSNPHTFTSLTPPVVSGAARAVAVNPVTNKIYAIFESQVVVVNGDTHAMTVIGASGGPVAAGINTTTNKVYVPLANGTLMVIDGATQDAEFIDIPTGAKAIAVNPVTNMAWVLNATSVTPIVGVGSPKALPLTTNITALPGNTTTPTGSITLEASSTMGTGLGVRRVYYQLDSTTGPWTLATGSGPWTAPFSGLSTGSHTIYAFATNGLDAPSITTDVQNNPLVGSLTSYTFNVVPATVTPTVSITSSQNPSASGQSVTFAAAVSGTAGTATGTVTFNDGGSPIAGCSSVALDDGAATCATSLLSVGSHSITAAYSGNASYNPAQSSPLTQVVEASISTNYALAANGATASESSGGGANFPVSSLINGDRAGLNWGSGGGWRDGTANVYPDWVRIDFDGPKTIDRVVVYSLQDNPSLAVDPPDSMTFAEFGATSFTVEGWDGSGWVPLANVAGNNLVKRSVTFAPYTTTAIRVNILATPSNYSRLVEIEAWGTVGAAPPGTNVAASANGGTASESTGGGASFPVSSLVDGDRTGANWGAGGGWRDATPNAWPDWVRIDFSGAQTIDRVVVYSLQDNPSNAVEPTDSMTFQEFGVRTYTVEAWDGSGWVLLASVSGNSLVKSAISFAPYTTTAIRVNILATASNYSRLVEIEAWTPGGENVNHAAAANGATASESTSGGGSFPVASLINGDRRGMNWAAGGGWKDGTANAYPDWVQVDFAGMRTIGRVVVYSLQDNPSMPVEPTDATTFVEFGATSFTVEAWNGSSWDTVATVNGNNLVKRTVTFTPVSTPRIRVNVLATPSNYSRLVEVEAFSD